MKAGCQKFVPVYREDEEMKEGKHSGSGDGPSDGTPDQEGVAKHQVAASVAGSVPEPMEAETTVPIHGRWEWNPYAYWEWYWPSSWA